MRISSLLVALTAITFSTSSFAADFASVDTDANGEISIEEFAEAHPNDKPEIFAAIDLNSDKMIDAEEFELATSTKGTMPTENQLNNCHP